MSENTQPKRGRPKKTEEEVTSEAIENLEKEKPAASDDTITLPKKQFDGILDRLEQLEKGHSKLEEVADKRNLARWNAQHKEAIRKRCNVRTWDGKVIVGWQMVLDQGVEQDAKGRWTEQQTIRITTEDGEHHEMPYDLFAKRYVLIGAEIIEETTRKTDDIDQIFYTIRTEDNREFTLQDTFIN